MTATDTYILPVTSIAALAETLLLFVSQDAITNELAEGFVAGVKDDNSRRTLSLALTKSRENTARMAELYQLLKGIEPFEEIVRSLVEQLHQQERLKRGPSAAA